MAKTSSLEKELLDFLEREMKRKKSGDSHDSHPLIPQHQSSHADLEAEMRAFMESEEERRKFERRIMDSEPFHRHIMEAHGGKSDGLIVFSGGKENKEGLDRIAAEEETQKQEKKPEFMGYQGKSDGKAFGGYTGGKSSASEHFGGYLGGQGDDMHSADCACGKVRFELDFDGNIKEEKNLAAIPGQESRAYGEGKAANSAAPSYSSHSTDSGKHAYGSFGQSGSKTYK